MKLQIRVQRRRDQTPYWAKRLKKTELRAYQASSRGGELVCRISGDRVELRGCCVFYLEGEVEI